MPAIVKAQTTRQAKAAYNARGRPTLSDKQQRQLSRAIELKQRAERAREADKRRSEAAKKRALNEKPKTGDARLGSQRRTDKFGFVASQFHLGQFFGKPRGHSEVAMAGRAANMDGRAEAELPDEFGSDDLDDDALLEALESRGAAKQTALNSHTAATSSVPFMPPPRRQTVSSPPQSPRPSPGAGMPSAVARPPSRLMPPPPPRLNVAGPRQVPQQMAKQERLPAAPSQSPTMLMRPPPWPNVNQSKAQPTTRPSFAEDFASFWDELDTSTQVARDLGDPGPSEPAPENWQQADQNRTGSFSSGDFDMTEEELDELDPPKTPAFAAGRPTCKPPKVMAPPTMPTKMGGKVKTCPLPPPQLPTVKPQSAITGPFLPASSLYCSPDLGFTSTQLESFIDDDIQLTQAIPG